MTDKVKYTNSKGIIYESNEKPENPNNFYFIFALFLCKM